MTSCLKVDLQDKWKCSNTLYGRKQDFLKVIEELCKLATRRMEMYEANLCGRYGNMFCVYIVDFNELYLS